MSVTIDVICYKSKVLANNESPLMLRITKDRKRKYSSIGISVNPVYWDFQKNKPKRHCPNKSQIERVIAAKISESKEQVLDLKAESKEFTATSLMEKVKNPVKFKTVGDLFLMQINLLKAEKRTGYAMSLLEVYNSLIKFNGHLDIYFSDIDINGTQVNIFINSAFTVSIQGQRYIFLAITLFRFKLLFPLVMKRQ